MADNRARELRDRGFGADTGACPPALAEALAAYAADPGAYPSVLQALAQARVLLPAVAMPGEDAMAAPLLQGADGRLALLVFSSTETLRAWNGEARALPVHTPEAAQTALRDDAAAMLLDLVGPTTALVEGEDLIGLASGWTLGLVDGGRAWIRPRPE